MFKLMGKEINAILGAQAIPIWYYVSQKVDFDLIANSTATDEMPHSAAFHRGVFTVCKKCLFGGCPFRKLEE